MRTTDNARCFICWDDETTLSPLVKPCNCTSMFAHPECFSEWINNLEVESHKCAVCAHDYAIEHHFSATKFFKQHFGSLFFFCFVVNFPVAMYARLWFQGVLSTSNVSSLLLAIQIVLILCAYALFGAYLYTGSSKNCFRRVYAKPSSLTDERRGLVRKL